MPIDSYYFVITKPKETKNWKELKCLLVRE